MSLPQEEESELESPEDFRKVRTMPGFSQASGLDFVPLVNMFIAQEASAVHPEICSVITVLSISVNSGLASYLVSHFQRAHPRIDFRR